MIAVSIAVKFHVKQWLVRIAGRAGEVNERPCINVPRRYGVKGDAFALCLVHDAKGACESFLWGRADQRSSGCEVSTSKKIAKVGASIEHGRVSNTSVRLQRARRDVSLSVVAPHYIQGTVKSHCKNPNWCTTPE